MTAATLAHDGAVTTTAARPRCPFPGCPIRYRGGPDRECPDHQPDDIGWNERLEQMQAAMLTTPGNQPDDPR